MKLKHNILIGIILLCVLAGGTIYALNNDKETTVVPATTTTQESNTEVDVTKAITGSYSSFDLDESYDESTATKIDLNNNEISSDGEGVEVSNSIATITTSGTYIISGEINDGQIIVDAGDSDDVKIVLKDAKIVSSSTSPIYVKNADKTVITLAEKTTNTITDSQNYSDIELSSAIYSKDDLTINGSGTLNVNANYNNAIESNDDLKIVNGNITINSIDDALLGKNSVSVKSGTLNITSSGDAIKSTNEVDANTGYVVIDGGNLNIEAGGDGIQAFSNVSVNDGTTSIIAGGGNQTAISSDISTNGIKSDSYIFISNGEITVDSSDDAIHSNNSIVMYNGSLNLTSGDDGIHADTLVEINDGKIDVIKAYEGIEALNITINNGSINLTSTDDGINAAGGNDSSGGFGGDNFSSGSGLITINNGNIVINAGTSNNGDGLDANGNIVINGSVIKINSPSNPADYEAVDYDGSITMSAGSLYVDNTMYDSSSISSLPSMHGGGGMRR